MTHPLIICDSGICDFCGDEGVRTLIYQLKFDDDSIWEIECCETCFMEDEDMVAGNA